MDQTEKEKREDLKEPLLAINDEEKEQNPYKYQAPPPQIKQITTSEALRKISSIAVYPIIGMICHPAYHICNSIILGQNTDPTLLGALGLGGITISIFLQSVGVSFNGSLDTLIAQAYGQKDKRLCWVYLNRQVYLAMIMYIPLSLLVFFFCESVFIALGQDPYLSAQAAIYVRVCVPGSLASTLGTCYGRFLSGQRTTIVGMYSNVAGTLLHIPLAIFLAVYLDWGMWGIAIASCLQFIMRFAVCIGYIYFNKRFHEGFVSLRHPDCFKNWKSQFYLSLQCASLGVWSWWAFDIFTLIASYLSVAELAAQTVLRNIGLLTYMIPVGIAQSSSILVGNMIGAKNIYGAKLYAKMCTVTAFIWAVGSVIFINVLQTPVVTIFSSSPSVNSIIILAFPIISFFVFFDCVQGVGQGIIRGLGKQGRASTITVTGYWVIGIPVSLVSVFYFEWGIVGLWYGPSIAIVFNWFFYYMIVIKSDWQKIADEAEQRRLKEQAKN